MCYRVQINADKIKLPKRFNATFDPPEIEFQDGEINGFSHPQLPIIADNQPNIIQTMEWGLIPTWANDKSFQKNTLNCKIETAATKPSFRNSINQRCLVIVSGFYEWKHVSENNKLTKHKYFLSAPNQEFFSLAGLYNSWNGINSFTILTTKANELMAEIHNTKKRMPVVLKQDEESLWLGHETLDAYGIRSEIELVATKV